MNSSALLGVLIASALASQAEAQISSNVFRRVLMIRPAGSNDSGTGFTLEADGRQYLITAKHVVAGMKAEGTIEFREGEKWLPLPVKIFRCDDPVAGSNWSASGWISNGSASESNRGPQNSRK